MPRLSISLSEERYEHIEKMVDDGVVNSKSKAVNKLIEHGEKADKLAQRVDELEARLEESRQREIARDKTDDKLDVLRQDLEQERRSADAPFFVRWLRWYRRR